MKETIRRIADAVQLNEDNIRDFLNASFSQIAKDYGLTGDQFQARAGIMGEAFEHCFEVIMERFYPDIRLVPNVEIPDACMERGGEADFVIYKGGLKKLSPIRLVAVIEAKGSSDHIVGVDGKRVELTRPGMMRTDTVKKAISNAYQISRTHPDALFFIVTSHKPTGGNAKCMCDLAEGDIVDKIVDVTKKEELDEMVKMIRDKLST
jgi:hypothetical protein